MWRHISRGIKQGLKRGLCIEKDRKLDVHNQTCCIKELLPSVFQNLNNVLKQDDGNQEKREYSKRSSRNISQHTFLEAFGWSGALVFGWAISKQLWFKQLWTRDNDSVELSKGLVQSDSFVQVLLQIVKTQPPVSCVLPQLQSTSPANGTKVAGAKISPNIDDEFDAAAKELQAVHEKVIGEALNRRAIACLSNSTNSEAMSYFQRASELKYPPASFNMGQCYELGIGTTQDFTKAAEWYKIASDQGHATAMYNLGVFYAHGWGGLKADIDSAKMLFGRAAKLGQPDAKAALDKEYALSSNINCKINSDQSQFSNSKEATSVHIKSPELNIFVNSTRNGLADDIFQRGFISERKNWDVPFNSAVAY